MLKLLTVIALAALATPKATTQKVWQVAGSEEIFAAVKKAAADCKYSDVKEVYGEHLVPYLHIVIPKSSSVEYECLRRWLDAHPELGSGMPSPPQPKS